jgi:hypothetical protein
MAQIFDAYGHFQKLKLSNANEAITILNRTLDHNLVTALPQSRATNPIVQSNEIKNMPNFIAQATSSDFYRQNKPLTTEERASSRYRCRNHNLSILLS